MFHMLRRRGRGDLGCVERHVDVDDLVGLREPLRHRLLSGPGRHDDGDSLECRLELLGRERLGQVAHGARARRLDRRANRRVSRHDDDRDPGPAALHDPDHVEAPGLRHHQVGQDHVEGGVALERLHRVGDRQGLLHAVSLAGEDLLHAAARDPLVIHHQHAHHLGLGHHGTYLGSYTDHLESNSGAVLTPK
ncbi:MAG: hypothetical protein MZV64_28045 [Ignavibacteriales bacterium]|nr:hypothetical protein [Ignavibacteriales bacterium]